MPITPSDSSVRRHGPWSNNAELMVDVDRLGYLGTSTADVLDATYGEGRFWTLHTPPNLTATDIRPLPDVDMVADFTRLPFADQSFHVVVFDPPYRLNGTPDQNFDEGYGIHVPTRWQDRMQLIALGAAECARVASSYLLVKCQDQVCSGKMRWQTDMVTTMVIGGFDSSFRKVDRFELSSYREQPPGRRQVHARTDSSTLLVFGRS